MRLPTRCEAEALASEGMETERARDLSERRKRKQLQVRDEARMSDRASHARVKLQNGQRRPKVPKEVQQKRGPFPRHHACVFIHRIYSCFLKWKVCAKKVCTPPRTQRPVRYMTPLEGAADRAQSPCPPPWPVQVQSSIRCIESQSAHTTSTTLACQGQARDTREERNLHVHVDWPYEGVPR